jgi:hypothetical protein
MRSYLIIISMVIFSALSAKYSTWLAIPPQDQLTSESADDQLGFGRLFVPVMTESEWEPFIKIYNSSDMTVSDEYRPGKSIFLKPGKYTMVFGSSSDPVDMVQKHFNIFEHQTTVVEPDWSALIVSVINEDMEQVRYGYEIMHMESGISVGTKYSKDESSFNDINSTWILPPGKYKIVRLGENFNTITNFSTFELNRGELTEMTVVINDVQNFIGAGEIGLLDNFDKRRKAWRNILNLKGSVTLRSYNDENIEENRTDITTVGKVDNKFIYDLKPYYFNFRQLLNEEFERKEDIGEFRISRDELRFTSTGIYYFTDVFGLYGEINLDTKIFSDNYYDIEGNILKLDKSGDSLLISGEDKFKLSQSFSPLNLEESVGLNFTFVKSSESELYLRAGFGFKQNFNNDVYRYSSELSSDSLFAFTEQKNLYSNGLVFRAGADFNFTNNITYISTASLFYNLEEDQNYNLRWENDLLFKIFKYVSLDYNFILQYDHEAEQANYMIYDNRIALEFSSYINR